MCEEHSNSEHVKKKQHAAIPKLVTYKLMGNTSSNHTMSSGRHSKKHDKRRHSGSSWKYNKGSSEFRGWSGDASALDDPMRAHASKLIGDVHAGIASGIRIIEEHDHPATQLLESLCGAYLDPINEEMMRSKYRDDDDNAFGENDSLNCSDEETSVATDCYRYSSLNLGKLTYREDETSLESRSHASEFDTSTFYEITKHKLCCKHSLNRSSCGDSWRNELSYLTEDDRDTCATSRLTASVSDEETASIVSAANTEPSVSTKGLPAMKPVASFCAKHCFFTKARIGRYAQHYEGLTLTGDTIVMLPSAMKLKGCPTICDEDLRHIEVSYPGKFLQLPDELLLSSGWSRISKYCHFSKKPIPDGTPFFRKL
jgi:hypothetical protein